MWGVLGQGCPPAWGLPTAWLSVGYLFIIYGVWGSPRTWREQEDSAGVSPAHAGFAGVQNGAGKATAMAGGCGSRDGAAGGWWPWDHVSVPWGH